MSSSRLATNKADLLLFSYCIAILHAVVYIILSQQERRVGKPVRQINLWENLNRRLVIEIDVSNGIGPFAVRDDEFMIRGINRQFDCGFYRACLSLAAGKNWESFTCKGCFRRCQQSQN